MGYVNSGKSFSRYRLMNREHPNLLDDGQVRMLIDKGREKPSGSLFHGFSGQGLLQGHGHGHRGADHGIVTHADKAHHLHMGGHRG